MLVSFLLSPIEKFINRYLALDPEIFAQLQMLAGKVLLIEIKELGLCLHLLICGRGIQLCQPVATTAHASLQGSPLTLLKLLLQTEPLHLIRNGEIIIEGDIDFVQQLQALLQRLKIDWVEQLSHYLGDHLASQLGYELNQLRQWQQTTSQNHYQNLGEYLQEELRYLPPRAEIADFNQEVMALSLTVERLAARISRLAYLLQEHS